MAQRMAQKSAAKPEMWAHCLLGHCYGLWFLCLPAFVRASPSRVRALHTAYHVLREVESRKVVLPDEVSTLLSFGGLERVPGQGVRVGGLSWEAGISCPNPVGKASRETTGYQEPRANCPSPGASHPGVLPSADAAVFTLRAAGAVGAGHARDAAGRHCAQHHHLWLLQQGTNAEAST